MKQICFLLLSLVVSAQCKMEGFIVGGQEAEIEKYAYSVLLNVQCVDERRKKVSWICGASVVNQLIILTAGHCLHGCGSDSRVVVHLGNERRGKGIQYRAYSFVIHENYDPKTSRNDIALLRIERQLALNSKTKRVALMKNPPYDEKAKVAGWGMINEITGHQGDTLKFLQQNVIHKADCLKIYRYLAKGTLCARADSKEQYASQGDSGSALVVRDYIQIGIVSYKIPSSSRYIVIYTDVGYFYDWIKQYAKELTCVA